MRRILQSYNFIYFCNDFKGEFYYWECLIFVRKFVLCFFSAMNGTVKNEVILFMMGIILFFSIRLQINCYPYDLKFANHLEFNSLIVCSFTVVCVLIINSKSEQGLKFFMTVICFCLTLIFLGVCVYFIILDIINKRNRKQQRLTKKVGFNNPKKKVEL